jgi:uncharacterized protein with HEPN domain
LEQIETIEKYLSGVEAYSFYNNDMLKDACFARLIVVGEYVKKVSKKTQEDNPYIKWKEIVETRNFYVHAYNALDWTKVWETLQEDVPELKIGIQNILNRI